MKLKIIVMLIFAGFIFGITFQANVGDVKTPESALGGANTNTYRAYIDTISYSIWEHKYLTAQHEYADSTTYYLTENDSVYGDASNNLPARDYLMNIKTYLVSHMALDSCHNGAAD